MSDEQGSTLAEMLAALLVISLALGGLAEGLGALRRHQTFAAVDVTHAEVQAALQSELARVFALAPDAGRFRGTADRIDLECVGGRTCSLALRPGGKGATLSHTAENDHGSLQLEGIPSAHFAYLGDDTIYQRWPPSSRYVRLRGIEIIDGGNRPLAYLKVREQHPFRCRFDVISGNCREPAS